jgi:hypothetical protein
MRIRLLTSVLFGLLPLCAGAGPLFVELDSDRRGPSARELAALEACLERFAATLAHGDSADCAALFDPTRSTLLWQRLRDSDYGPALGGWLGGGTRDAASNRADLRRACARLGAGELDPRQHALVYADSALARRLWPRGDLPGLHIRHGQRRDAHPLLRESLELAWLTDLAWSDPRLDPWRERGPTPARACPLQPRFLRVTPPRWSTAAERGAWLDSLCRAEPALAETGWLKRKLLRGGLERMVELLATLGGARDRWRDGRIAALNERDRIAGTPPSAPPSDRAVLRLLFLRDTQVAGRWLLALAWFAPPQLDTLGDATLEPGFGPWADRYARWRAQALARIEAVGQR